MLKCPYTVYAKVRLEGLYVMIVVSFGQTTTTDLTVVHPMTAVRYFRKPDCHAETQWLGSRNQVIHSVITAHASPDARVTSGLQRAYNF